MVALYHGNVRPNANEFLTDFVNECIELSKKWNIYQFYKIPFQVVNIDLRYTCKIIHFSYQRTFGLFFMYQCDIKGDMVNKVLSFDDIENLHKRTDYSFRNKVQPEHHMGTSILLKIPNFNIIDNVPIDYMHCLLLGGTKSLFCNKIYGWIYGRPSYYITCS